MNVTVTIPITDFDNLRNEVKVLKDQNKTLSENQKQIKLIIARTNLQPATNGLYYPHLKEQEVVMRETFVNMDSVIEPITEAARKRVDKEFKNLEKSVAKAIDDLTQERLSHVRALASKEEAYESKLDKHKAENEKIVKKLKDEINELKNTNKDLTESVETLSNGTVSGVVKGYYAAAISDVALLKYILDMHNSKPWWKRFGKIKFTISKTTLNNMNNDRSKSTD